MYPKLTPENASEIVQEATQRLQVIDSHIKSKQSESQKIEDKIDQLNAELEVFNVEIELKRKELIILKIDTETEREKLEVLLKEEIEKQATLTTKLAVLYKAIQEASEELLRATESRVAEEEKRATLLLEEVQEKRRNLIGIKEEINSQEVELAEKKKTAFSIQKKIDELHEKEQFIKKKYEDAGINYQ